MRSDRLLAVVTLLRRHGRLSAAELARRLDVTPRTIARDIESLSLAGIPVYAERGRTGGYRLLPGYRPDAEDLTLDEARALFVAGGAGVADALGLGEPFARALRKLASAMTEEPTQQVGHTLERVIIDPGGWDGTTTQPSALSTVFAAVQEDRRLLIEYRARSSGEGGRRTVDPWGLVLAGPTWYLVAAHRGRPHTYRVSRIASIRELPEAARRPSGLDLLATWHELRAAWGARPVHRMTLRVQRDQAESVVRFLAVVLRGTPDLVDDGPGHVLLTANVTSLRGVVGVVLGFGAGVEAVDPQELRQLMVEVAREALAAQGERDR